MHQSAIYSKIDDSERRKNIRNLFSSDSLPQTPKCPNQNITTIACVTQSCKYNPFMCSQSCQCINAHKFCKTMQWRSILSMLNNYSTFQTAQLRGYIQKIQEIYLNVTKKISAQLQNFYSYVETKLYEKQYQQIKYYLKQEQFSKITSKDLGMIISKLTKDKQTDRRNDYSIESFTLNQMRGLDTNIKSMLKQIQKLYIKKFKVKGDDGGFTYQKDRSQSTQSKIRQTDSSGKTSYKKQSQNPQVADIQTLKQMSQSLTLRQQSRIDPPFYKASSINFAQTAANTNWGETVRSTGFTKFAQKPDIPLKNVPSASKLAEQQRYSKMLEKSSVVNEYPKHIPSKILKSASNLNCLLNIGKIKEYRLLYRASDNQFSIKEFYRRMSFRYQQNQSKNQPMTVLLVKTQYDKVVAGCTKMKWINSSTSLSNQEDSEDENSKSKYKQDIKGTTYFFSIDMNQRYQLQQPKYAIYCGKNSIGFGRNDLRINNNANKHNKNSLKFPSSFNNGLYLPIKKSSLTLNGSHDSYNFKVIEWEMFEVMLEKNHRNIYQHSASTKNIYTGIKNCK